MIDEIYGNSFKEVYDILINTEEELVSKIPSNFMKLLKDNMNVNYKTNINTYEELDKQHLLKETEAILSLIYRSYWSTDEELQEFALQDKTETKKTKSKDIYQVFEERKNINKITIDNNLMVIKKENAIKSFFSKIMNLFKRRRS